MKCMGYLEDLWSDYHPFLVGGGFVLLVAGLAGWLYGPRDPEASGIEAGPDGQVLYLAGESCTIDTPLSATREDLLARAAWCADQHERWRGGVP